MFLPGELAAREHDLDVAELHGEPLKCNMCISICIYQQQ